MEHTCGAQHYCLVEPEPGAWGDASSFACSWFVLGTQNSLRRHTVAVTRCSATADGGGDAGDAAGTSDSSHLRADITATDRVLVDNAAMCQQSSVEARWPSTA